MKKLIIALVSLSSFLLANEFPSTNYQFNSEELLPQNSSEKWKLLPYAHVEAWIPGLGVCARIPREKMQIEFNFKTAHSPSFIDFYSGSISILPTIYKNESGQAYLGIGAGACYLDGEFIDIPIAPTIPLFIGYEDTHIFADLGVDVVLDPIYDYTPVSFPTLRAGFKF